MQKIDVPSRTARKGFGLIVLITILLCGCGGGGGAGSSSSGDWYYHWSCNGDSECLALGPGTVGQTEGTINEGPEYAMCSPLLIFSSKFWNMPPATDSCDHSPTMPPPPPPTITGFTPAGGASGTSVTITGTYFGIDFGTSGTVRLNGIAVPITNSTNTQIVITIPSMADFTGPLVITNSGGTVTSSSNYSVTTPGITWQPSATTITAIYRGVAWSGSQYVAVGDSAASSLDAISWTNRPTVTLTPPPGGSITQQLNSITYSNSLFAAVGLTTSRSACCILGQPGGVATNTRGTVLTTSNGISWTSQTSETIQQLFGTTWSGTQLVAVGAAGTIQTSPSGVTWTVQVSGVTPSLNGVVWSATQNKFVAIGATGSALTSNDGVTWGAVTSGTANNLNGIDWCGNQFVAVGDAGTMLTSSDGTTWITRNSGTSNALYGVACSATQLVAVGAAGTIVSSTNGVTWVTRLSGTTNPLYGITWSGRNTLFPGNPSKFVTVGNGIILSSQ